MLLLLAVAVLTASAPVAAQEKYPIFTSDNLSSIMETLGPNVAAVRVALENRDFESGKAQLVRSREQLATTVTFWRDHEQEEAVGFLRRALDRMDALDDMLSSGSDTVDADAATGLLGEIDVACQSCHAIYREENPTTGQYQVKRSALSP